MSGSHHKEAPKAAEKAPEKAYVTDPWKNAARGEVWVDDKGREHVIVGVVSGGFDSRCAGVDENHRLVPFDKANVAAVTAWKRKD